MSDFALIVTSRGRPESWDRLAPAIAETTEGELDVYLVLDDDDPTGNAYVTRVVDDRIRWWTARGPRLGHIGSLNEHAVPAAAEHLIVGQMGDDHVPRTPGWDLMVRDALATPGIVYGDDLLQGPNLPTAVFMHSAIIRATGKFAPEGLWHLYADNYWRDLGQQAGCLRYLPDMVIEHLHYVNQKAQVDATYLDSNAPEVDRADHDVWTRYQAAQLAYDVAAVKAVL